MLKMQLLLQVGASGPAYGRLVRDLTTKRPMCSKHKVEEDPINDDLVSAYKIREIQRKSTGRTEHIYGGS